MLINTELEKMIRRLERKICCSSTSTPPSYTEDERNALTPQPGKIVFNTDTSKLNFWNGSGWEVITSVV